MHSGCQWLRCVVVAVLQVREVAAMTLSGAMHCGFLQMNSDMLVSLFS